MSLNQGKDDPMDTPNSSELRAYIALQLIGLIGCFIIFVTGFFAESALRHTAWFSFYVFLGAFNAVISSPFFISGRLQKCTLRSVPWFKVRLMYSAPTL